MSNKNNKRCIRTSPEALFRFLAVSQVLARTGAGEAIEKAVHEVAALPLRTVDGELRRVSKRTLYRWLAAYQAAGQEGLERKRRPAQAASQVLDERLLSFSVAQKEQDPRVSIPEIIARAAELGIIKPGQRIDRSTLYRTLKRRGVAVGLRRQAKSKDGRRYAYPHRMQMILADGKHFRAGPRRAKRVALFFLDDATRRGLEVVVGTAESSELFLRGLYNVVRRFGFFIVIYLDHGPGFIAQDTVSVVASLGALLIHGTVAYPEGHGKIERFNRTAKSKVLRTLDRSPEVDADCGALTLRLSHWLRQGYNLHPHESLGGETPLARFERDSAPLRFPEDHADLERRFVVYLERRVSNDNVVSVDSTAYEMPKGHAGEKVVIHRRLLTKTLHVLHEGCLIELHPVDLAANARSRRGSADTVEEDVEHPLPPSAADLAYGRAFGPVVGRDGGFPLPPKPNTEDESSS